MEKKIREKKELISNVVIMMMVEDIQQILSGQSINASEEEITATILQAKSLVGMEYFSPTDWNEFVPDFDDNVYVTDFYPVIPDSLVLKINAVPVSPYKINYSEGIIYLKYNRSGTLEVDYQYGYSDDVLNDALVPLVVELYKQNNNYNLGSISEGDVSISYASNVNTNGTGVNTIDTLVNSIREMYNARVKLL